MEFKKLLSKVHDKVSHANPPVNSPSPTRQQSIKDKRHATLAKWRDKWGDVPLPRFFSNNNKNNDISNHSNNNNSSNNDNIYSQSCYTSSPLPLPQIPTITLSTPSLLKRSQSTISPRPPSPVAMTPSSSRKLPPRQKPRPISYTPRQTQTLSVPHVVDHLRSPYHIDYPNNDNDNNIKSSNSNSNSNSNSDDGGGGRLLYKTPIRYSTSPSPSRQVTWYIPTSKTSLDDTTDSSMENDSVASMMSNNLKSSMSSSSSSITGLMAKNGTKGTSEDSSFPLDRQDSAFLGNEIIQPHKESNNDTDDEDGDDDDKPILTNIDTTATTSDADASICQKVDEGGHYPLVLLNVSNTMMMMREHQLELQMTRLRIDNQRLQQQIDDMVSGTWSTTTQLLAENDQLELQIQQLRKQQRLVRSSIAGKGELHWRDEQEALRHTRAQLGLVEYLEGEPDVMAALNRFKKLLMTSC